MIIEVIQGTLQRIHRATKGAGLGGLGIRGTDAPTDEAAREAIQPRTTVGRSMEVYEEVVEGEEGGGEMGGTPGGTKARRVISSVSSVSMNLCKQF